MMHSRDSVSLVEDNENVDDPGVLEDLLENEDVDDPGVRTCSQSSTGLIIQSAKQAEMYGYWV